MVTMTKLESEPLKAAGKLQQALGHFKALHLQFPVQQMILLLQVAKEGETTVTDLAQAMDMPQSTVSRQLIFLSDHPERKDEARYGFVTFRPDPVDMRVKNVTLTPRGRAFVNKLLS